MIQAYCSSCGLYLTIPEQYAGGRGGCPRCQLALRIPRPVSEAFADVPKGYRLLAEPYQSGQGSIEPILVDKSMGASCRYLCKSCGEEFESIGISDVPPEQCPKCKHLSGPPIESDIEFPRAGRSAAEAREAAKNGMRQPIVNVDERLPEDAAPLRSTDTEEEPMEDGEPVNDGMAMLPVAVDQEVGDDVLDGLPLLDDQKDVIDSTPEPVKAEEPEWLYLKKGQKKGPYTTHQMQEMAAAGKITATTSVYHPGSSGWRALTEFKELQAPPEPVEEKKVELTPQVIRSRRHKRKQLLMLLLFTVLVAGAVTALCLIIMP